MKRCDVATIITRMTNAEKRVVINPVESEEPVNETETAPGGSDSVSSDSTDNKDPFNSGIFGEGKLNGYNMSDGTVNIEVEKVPEEWSEKFGETLHEGQTVRLKSSGLTVYELFDAFSAFDSGIRFWLDSDGTVIGIEVR